MDFWIKCGAMTGVAPAAAILAAAGMFLASVEQSGERVAGSLLIAVAAAMVFAAIFLVRAPARRFAGTTGRITAVAAAMAGALPLAGLAVAALSFAGLPFASRTPAIDWSVFAAGLLFALGAGCVAALAWRRVNATPAAKPAPADARTDQAVERPFDWNEEVRVRRV